LHRKIQTDQSPSGCHKNSISASLNPLGEIFRDYGEIYIQQYKPPLQHIKLIRSMRICKTPGLGGKKYICKNCNHYHYVYLGCGNSRCSICQRVKREQWIDKLRKKLLAVPYVHLVTTMPHELNSLARKYPREVYNILFKVTRDTVYQYGYDPKYLGAKPGLISILHTFGSDIKYHVHVHSLMTFGGIDKNGNWQYPKDKTRLCPHKKFRNTFRDNFIATVHQAAREGKLKLEERHRVSLLKLKTKSWSYYVTPPAMSIENIELYIARYINHVAVTNSRLSYLKETNEVKLIYNDYRNQIDGQPAPKKTTGFDSLSFIHQYLMHVPPPYFQKTRWYGIHSSTSQKKYKSTIESLLRKNGQTVRTVMEIIRHLLKVPTLRCEKCAHDKFEVEIVSADRHFIKTYLRLPNIRSP